MECIKCKKILDLNDKFCSGCGVKNGEISTVNNILLKRLLIISSVILFGSILSFWAYFYYQILRIVVTITAIYYVRYNYKETYKYDYLMIIVAILFNPIAPLFFDRAIWLVFDIIAGFILINRYKKI